jgi:hypothetical protein
MRRQRIRVRPTVRRDLPWPEVLALDPRDQLIVRGKADQACEGAAVNERSGSHPRWAGDTRARRDAWLPGGWGTARARRQVATRAPTLVTFRLDGGPPARD